MPKPVSGHGRYMGGLDGLRAIAVLAVIAYHLNFSWASGGLLGVGVFFVLSGYLITDLLVAGWEQKGRIDLKDFWTRRARRLLPALFVMLAVVVAWVTVFDRSQLAFLRGDVLAAVLYVSNWWYIFHHVSYFASFGPPSPLTHLWSLAVEEQFYLIWPLLLGLGLRYIPRRGWLLGATLTLAAASACAMALIYQPGTNPDRVYYGTDTRAFGLLIGGALALVWRSGKLSNSVIKPWVQNVLDVVGGIGIMVVLFMMWKTNQYQPFLYRGGLVVLSLATAGVVAALTYPTSLLSKILGFKPLRWIGVRSYGIYLWHYPVIILTSPTVNTKGANLLGAGLQVAFSVALAALSWKYIEEPIRHGSLGRWWHKVRLEGGHWVPGLRWIPLLGGSMILAVAGVGLMGLVPSSMPSAGAFPVSSLGSTIPIPSPLLFKTHDAIGHSGGALKANSFGAGEDGHGMTAEVSQATPAVTVAKPTPQSGAGMTAIGDSVMIDASPYLKQLFPGIVISAQVGRQLYQTPAVIAQLRSKGELGRRIILELGTNGPFTQGQLVSLLQSLGPVQQIILVNTRVPRPWQNVVNATLAQVAATFPHTTLVNWYAASANHNQYFYPDGVHLNPSGAQVYAELVAKALNSLHS